jgi:hypothetical protein
MHAARTSYHTLKQWKLESLGDFRKRFDAAIETLRQSGVADTQLPSSAIKAVDYANALDKTRFSQFLVDYRNGLLQGLDTVDKVQSRAECYVTLQSQQADKPAQIILCSETRKPAGNSSKQNKKTKNGGGDSNTTHIWWRIYVATHVDDILVISASRKERERIQLELGEWFELSPQTGTKISYLGLNIIHDKTKNQMKISQEEMIKDMVKSLDTTS